MLYASIFRFYLLYTGRTLLQYNFVLLVSEAALITVHWHIYMCDLLFLYLTNKVEFGQDILQGCVSLYHLHV